MKYDYLISVLKHNVPFLRGILLKSSLRVSWYPNFAGSTISTTWGQILFTVSMVWYGNPVTIDDPMDKRGVEIDKYACCASSAYDWYISC